jgi:hypothetical protein
MTRYWIKIAAGALLIFAAGMGIWFGVRKGVRTVHTVFETSDPISIPLKFATFRVDGAALGKLERLRLLRTAPKEITSVQVTVRLDSASYADRIRGCTMRIDDVEKIDERTTFVCITGDAPMAAAGAFEQFGEVMVEGTDIVLPLFLPAAAVQDLRDHGPPNADSIAATVPPPPATPGVNATPQVQVTPPSN